MEDLRDRKVYCYYMHNLVTENTAGDLDGSLDVWSETLYVN